LNVEGEHGHRFEIRVRDNPRILLDFCIILQFIDANGERFTLVRYNGKHPSAHTNKWEKKRDIPNATFQNAFHIHRATERYQTDPECAIDGYAEVTDLYHSFESALRAFVSANGFRVEPDADAGQMSLPFAGE
jgi:hypothetical protein